MAATPVVKVIYGKPMLPDVARVLTCIYEKKINFKLEDMNRGKEMSPDIINLQMSSHGHTPGLQDGQDELFGSRKICRHIIEKYGAYGYQDLLGKDPLARVSVEQWIQSEEQKFDPPSSDLVFYLAYKIESDEEPISQSKKKLEKVLNLYEQRLGECEFLGGNYFTLADLYHLPNSYYLESSEEYGYLFKDRKNVCRWWNNISSRDSWKNVVKKLEEEGLPIKVSVISNETRKSPFQPSSFPPKNGIKNGPSTSSESKKDEHSPSGEEKGAAGNKKEHSPSEGEKGGKGPEVPASDNKGKTPPINKDKPGTVGENKELGKDKKYAPKSDDKDTAPPGNKEKSDIVGENKELGKDKKDETKSYDRNKAPLGDKLGTLGENKELGNDKKEAPKSDGKDKASHGNNENHGAVVENKELGKGKIDAPKSDDKDKAPAGNSANKNENRDTIGSNTMKDSLPADKIQTPNSDGKDKASHGNNDNHGTVIENKEFGKGKIDAPKSNDKDKAPAGNNANKNETRDTIGSNTEKNSLPDEEKDKISSSDHNKFSLADDKEKKTN